MFGLSNKDAGTSLSSQINPLLKLMGGNPAMALKDMMLPDIDKNAVLASQQRDMEVMVQVNHIMSESEQANFKKLMGMIHENTSKSLDSYNEIKNENLSADQLKAKSVEILQNMFDDMVAASKELTKDSRVQQDRAYDLLYARVREKLGEADSFYA